MHMEFCPKCGKLLIPKKEGKIKKLICPNPKCDFEQKLITKAIYEVSDKIKHKASDITEVVDAEESEEFSDEELVERRERFIENIDLYETDN